MSGDDTQTTKVHRVTLLVIDFDDIGADGVKQTIECTKYPNHCMSPEVKRIETRTVEFHDEHPLNLASTAEAAYEGLFEDEVHVCPACCSETAENPCDMCGFAC